MLDADIVIHLFKADKISLLNALYPGRLRMLDIVLTELQNNRTIRDLVENLFTFKHVEEISFPTTSNPALLSEYLSLRKVIAGNGERASLLYCKHHNHIIASSNTKDIIPFSKEHSIAYLTTLDILAIAVTKELLTKIEANACIQKIVSSGSYLLCNTIEEYYKTHFKQEKISY